MKSIIDSIRVQIYERLSSPLFGSFVISWACWNHRFLLVLFSSLSVGQRFEFIDKHIYTSSLEVLNDCVIKPAFTAILFILLYPRISKFFYKDWLQRQVETKELRDEIEKATLLTREESQAIQMKILKIKDEYEERIENQAAEIEALKRNSTSSDVNQLPNEQQRIEKENRRDKIKIDSLVEQGTRILMTAQNLPSEMKGVQLADVQSWVTNLGEIIRRKYGDKSQKFADYSNAVATKNFYTIHSNWNAHIAQLLGVAKSIASDLEQDRS